MHTNCYDHCKKTKFQIRLGKNKRISLFKLKLISNNTFELEIRMNELDKLLCKLEFMTHMCYEILLGDKTSTLSRRI